MGDYALVPKVKARLGAGSSLITDGEQAGLYAFRKDFLRRIGLDGNGELALFDVMGDSMAPTIQHMDTVLVSMRETEPVNGQIYAIRVDDELLVKRILRTPGKLVVKSDNPAYESFEIDLAEPSANVEIIGRVRWQGRVY
jgi:phage repressor protein C with HTH and peptisase S24 domain